MSDIYESKYNSDLSNLFLYWRIGLSTTQYALENEQVQQFIEQDDTDYDVIVSEQFYQEAFLMFAHKYRAPIVTLCKLKGPRTKILASEVAVFFLVRLQVHWDMRIILIKPWDS